MACDCVPVTVWEPDTVEEEEGGTPFVCGAAAVVAIFGKRA